MITKTITILFLLLLLSTDACSEEVSKDNENPGHVILKTPDSNISFPTNNNAPQAAVHISSGNALNVTVGLAAIIIIIGALAWFIKRFGNFSVTANGQLRILGGLHVGSRERVVLLQVGKQQLLVGVTANCIQTLCVLDELLPVCAGDDNNQTFAVRLMAAVSKQNKKSG
jgi:flagellar protein FliO/FliZ